MNIPFYGIHSSVVWCTTHSSAFSVVPEMGRNHQRKMCLCIRCNSHTERIKYNIDIVWKPLAATRQICICRCVIWHWRTTNHSVSLSHTLTHFCIWKIIICFEFDNDDDSIIFIVIVLTVIFGNLIRFVAFLYCVRRSLHSKSKNSLALEEWKSMCSWRWSFSDEILLFRFKWDVTCRCVLLLAAAHSRAMPIWFMINLILWLWHG